MTIWKLLILAFEQEGEDVNSGKFQVLVETGGHHCKGSILGKDITLLQETQAINGMIMAFVGKAFAEADRKDRKAQPGKGFITQA